MKKFNVLVSEPAEEDLNRIFDFIVCQTEDLEPALRWLNVAESQITSLEELPERFPQVRQEPWKSKGWRYCVMDKYRLFYRIDGNDVVVTRVMRCSQKCAYIDEA